MPPPAALHIRPAVRQDCPLILHFIWALAEYEKLSHRVIATESRLTKTLFGGRPGAEVLIAEWLGEAAGFALYFPNYSTFLAQPGIYLEDLFVIPEFRSKGFGRQMLVTLARLARERNSGRLEWSVLDWNQPAIDFYLKIGARPQSEWTVFRMDEMAIQKLAE